MIVGRENRICSEKNVSQCRFVHHKSQNELPSDWTSILDSTSWPLLIPSALIVVLFLLVINYFFLVFVVAMYIIIPLALFLLRINTV